MKSTRIPRVLIMISMCLAMLLPVQAYAASNQLVYGSNGTITRAEWIHDLVVTFNMTVDEGLKPDDYYDDIKGTTYYDDIITAMYFGVIDLDAGEKFEPDAKVTREFAAHTLSYCLGYQPDEDMEYTMSDQSELEYPADDQIAVDKGWFALTGGKFQPKSQITTAQIRKMLQDAAKIVADSEVDENHNNVYEFADGVVEVPETSSFEFGENNQIILYDTSIAIKKNTVFAVYSNGIAYTYKATKVDKQEDCLVIDTQVVSYDDAVDSVDAEGIIEADLQDFVAADGVDCEIEYEDTSTQASRIHGSKKIKDIKLSKQIGSGKVSCNITNIVVEYRLENGNYRFAVKGKMDTDCTFSGKKELSLPFGYLNIAGVGKIEVKMIYSAKGSATVGFTTNVTTGIEQTNGSPVRSLDNYTSPSWKFSAKAELKAACNINFTIEIPMIAKGYVYGEAGIKSTPDMEIYTDGKDPKVCIDLPAYLFAETGYSLTVGGQTLASATFPIYNEKNSPIKVCYHIEDGNCVDVCKRAGTSKRVGRRGYYTSPSITSGSGTYGGECFVAPYAEYKTFEYSLDDDGNATITKYAGNVKALTIPDELDGHPVVAIANDVFKGNTALQSVVIPDAVTSIGAGAFRECSNLSMVHLPDKLLTMEANTFYHCNEIRSIYIPGKLKECTANDYADEGGPFAKCDNLKQIIFDKELKQIPSHLLCKCTGIEEVSIPENITGIGWMAFGKCPNLKKVSMSDDVTLISACAFANCSELTTLKLSKGLTVLGDSAFARCVKLTEVRIPKSIKTIQYDYGFREHIGPFGYCSSLRTIYFQEGITEIPDNLFAECTGLIEISIPETVKDIGTNAFKNCSNLKKVQLLDGLINIKDNAFNTTALEEIVIPDTVASIGGLAFYNCKSMTSLKLSSNIRFLGENAFGKDILLNNVKIPKSLNECQLSFSQEGPFANCSNLSDIEFEQEITKIPKGLFGSCTGLTQITIPDTVVSIDQEAFARCVNLQNITFDNNLKSIGNGAFGRCNSLTQIVIPDAVQTIGITTFSNCEKLKEVKMPKACTYVPEAMFQNCTALNNITFSNNTIEISQNAFDSCTALVQINLPNKVQIIRHDAFINCKNLKTLRLAESLKTIERQAFYGCEALSEMTILEELTLIGENAFSNCKSLQTLKLPDSLETLEAYAFSNCDKLASVSLGAGIKTIPDYCFYADPEVKKIILPQQVTAIGKYAFGNCTKLTDITINRNVSTIDSTAFSYPDRLTIHGVTGTYPETFAKANDIKFVALDSSTTDIKISKETCEIGRGKTMRLTATVVPEDSPEELTWTSSDEDIVTVNNGVIKGVMVGTANILVMSGSVVKECVVKVYEPVSWVDLNMTSEELSIGDTLQLEAYVRPDTATYKDVTWSSDNESVATVGKNGLVTAKAYGTAKIMVTTKDQNCTRICTVTVKPIAVTGVELNTKKATIGIGETCQLTARILPENATNKNVTWTTNNPKVATVENGVVTGVANGTAVIIVKTEDAAKTASCTVTVKGESVVVTAITINKTSLELESDDTYQLTATITPQEAASKKLTWSSSDEEVATVKDGKITAKKAGTAIITVSAENGTVKASCQVKVSGRRVTGVQLSKKTMRLDVGNCGLLEAAVLPENAENQEVTWGSSDEDIATIDEKTGIVMGVAAGEADITVTTKEGNYTATCSVKVSEVEDPDDIIPVTEIKIPSDSELLPEDNKIEAGNQFAMPISVEPEDATNTDIIWISNNKECAEIDENGIVTAKKAGEVTITAVSVNGGKQAEYTFTVTGAILTAIELDQTQLYLQPGEERQISATTIPEGATAQFEWSSSDDSVAMVDEDGVVTAISTGKATITVVDKKYRDVKAMCVVTVQEKSAEKPGSDQAQQPSPGGTTSTPDATPTPQQPTPQPSTGQPSSPSPATTSAVNVNSISLAKVSGLKVKAKGLRKITISWDGVSNARNYQVQISMKKNFKKGSKVRISPKTKFTWKKLKKGKTYYVRVRACANDRYGAWSKAKKVKVK